jgi:hypothetical protein
MSGDTPVPELGRFTALEQSPGLLEAAWIAVAHAAIAAYLVARYGTPGFTSYDPATWTPEVAWHRWGSCSDSGPRASQPPW